MAVRSHGRILVSIWRDRDFVALSVEAQRCYMMLLAQKDINNAGVQPLMLRKWARSCAHTTEDDILRSLDELQASRFVFYDDDTDELLVRSFIRNDGIVKQPNILKNALRVAEQTESERLRAELADELDSLGRRDASEVASKIRPEGMGNPSGTLSGPLNPSERVSKARGAGVGDGVGVTSSDGYVGGSRAHVRVREADANPGIPPRKCSRHIDDPNPPNCGQCADARRHADEVEAARSADVAAIREAAARILADCPDCDDAGWVLDGGVPVVPARKCAHVRRVVA